MEIYTLNPSTVALGQEAFRTSIRQYLGSAYEWRDGGAEVIPGAISAAIRAGITDENEICRVVGRVSRCRETTVSKVLYGLANEHVAGRLWARTQDGTFYPKGKAGLVPAAFLID